MVALFEYMTVLVGLFLAMCMYMALYGKGNPLYSFAEQTMIGVATGMNVVMMTQYIYRTGYLVILKGDWILIVGVILGIMIWFRLHPTLGYISRLPIAFTMGAQLGLSLRTRIFSGFIAQIKATMVPLFGQDLRTLAVNWVILISVVTMLTFFLYTIEIKGPLKISSNIGEYFMYIGFGVVFAQTFMGRLGLFVGFMMDSSNAPWKVPIWLGTMVVVLVTVVILDKANLLEKLTPEN